MISLCQSVCGVHSSPVMNNVEDKTQSVEIWRMLIISKLKHNQNQGGWGLTTYDDVDDEDDDFIDDDNNNDNDYDMLSKNGFFLIIIVENPLE